MNEEEKEAIKTIKSFKNMKWYNHAFDKGVEILTEEERREIDIIINLIEKQQKEIERKDKVFDDCKYTIIEYVKTAKDTMQKMEAMIEIEKDVINEFDKLLKGNKI